MNINMKIKLGKYETIFLVIAIVHLLMNALWLNIMYDKAFLAVLGTRLVPELIMIPIQVITMFFLLNILKPIAKKYLFNN